MSTEEPVEPVGPMTENVLLHSPGRVKAGLRWLQSEEAEKMGLSLERLIERAVKHDESAKYFDLSNPRTCAIGYASPNMSSNHYDEVEQAHGEVWVGEHGFWVDPGPGVMEKCHCGCGETVEHFDEDDSNAAYSALTNEWRQQLQALADEVAE